MKVLLRNYYGMEYVWQTATYNGKHFEVDGERLSESNIVSILNDNRKNYIMCSSCGKLFPKNGKMFEKHRKESSGINPCLKCHKLRAREEGNCDVKYTIGKDGTYTKKTKVKVDLICHYSTWNSFYIDSANARETCKFRQCENAQAMEIQDIFTKYPGLFDDIITVDKILDNGYVQRSNVGERCDVYVLSEEPRVSAEVNGLGIVNRFLVRHDLGFNYAVYYSKKYDMFFDGSDERYEDFEADFDDEYTEEIKNCIRKLYK